ncbi:SH3 domain-containing protein [Trichloromonas sp.]|uniref:SH3 domain-containing protein n=1 Tax=Trichloromonas sp. TaxID=3069249 RepID=UPI003D812661
MRFFAIVVMVLLLASAASAEVVTVAVSKAELRSKPSVGASSVVKTVTINTPLAVQKTQDRYLQVKDFQGNLGWIHETLVNKDKTVVVENDGVNVRKGPGKDHPVVFKAMRGEAFMVLDQAEDWLQIGDHSGRSGWIWKTLTWGL